MAYTVTFDSIPRDARVYLDGILKGKTRVTLENLEGRPKVIYKKTGYEDYVIGRIDSSFDRSTIVKRLKEEKEEPPEPPPTPPAPPTPPEYPKAISRGPYSFDAENAEQETQLKDFLGIEPPGVTLDEYLSKLNREENRSWNDYWRAIWINFNRPDLMQFTFDKADEYAALLPPIPPEETWWQKLLSLVVDPILSPFLVSESLFAQGYKAITGKDIDYETVIEKAGEIADWIFPVNIISKLITGKNIKGEPEEFGSGGDWFQLILMGVLLAIPGPVDDIAARAATKTISKTEAARLTAQLGKKETVARLIARVKANPTTSAKLLSKFPAPVRDAVIKGLGKTAFGRQTIYALGETGFFRFTRPIWSKAMANLFKVSGVVIAATLPIFAFTEIPNWLNMRQFARKQILEGEGNWPSSIAFKLNDLETLMRDYAYNIDKDIEALRSAEATEKIEKLKGTLEEFKSYHEEKKDVMLPEDYIWGTELIEFYNLFIEDREKRVAEILPPPVELPPKPGHGYLKISSQPEGAKITIAGHPEIIEEGIYLLLEGSYTIYYELEGYKPATKYQYVVEAETKEVSAVLIPEEEPEPEKAELLIISKPSFANVMIDGKATFQKTPYTAFLDEGTHTIRVELSDYEPEEEEIELNWAEEKTKEFILTRTPPTKGTLRIISEPIGAQVYIDGESKFATTPYTITLEAKTYKIRLTKDGFLPDEQDVIVEAGIEKKHEVELKEKPITKATITITSEPPEADIYIDGKFQFVETPYTVMLEPKDYILRVQKNGYYPVEIVVEIEEGEVSEIPFILEAIPEPEIPPEPYNPYVPYIPDYVPDEPYYPSTVTTPPAEIPPYNYNLLYPKIIPEYPEAPVGPPVEKELMINIETTDLMPTKGRIYSIALLDLTTPDAETQIMVSNDEEDLIRAFLEWFEGQGFVDLVGYNVSFDYRFIFTKMMKYRIPSKAFKDIELSDVMQIMKQVKEKFVFGFNRPGTLDEWGKMILGMGKYGSQELMLRKYIAGDFDYVRAFQNRQIELTKGLYDLARFCSLEGFVSSPSASPAPESSTETETPQSTGQKQCSVCKAYNPLSASICEICSTSI